MESNNEFVKEIQKLMPKYNCRRIYINRNKVTYEFAMYEFDQNEMTQTTKSGVPFVKALQELMKQYSCDKIALYDDHNFVISVSGEELYYHKITQSEVF